MGAPRQRGLFRLPSPEGAAPPRPRKSRNTSIEHAAQKGVVQWVTLHVKRYPELRAFHAGIEGIWIPGVPPTTMARVIAFLKEQGMGVGLPDLRLPVLRRAPDGRIFGGLWIEMKAPGEKPSIVQEAMHAVLRACGNRVEVCHGCDEATELIRDYLRMERL